jgi:predicted metal-dependent hydrolase
MEFEFESNGFERRWHGGSAFISHFWNALSTAFPAGEAFFVDTASSLKHRVVDPALRQELREFVRQEGHHAHQHRRFNRMLARQGFRVADYERRYAQPLRRAAERLHPMEKLAVTIALEHFTAVFAQQVLRNPAVTHGADPAVMALWTWHATEEIEHKASCFELYERLGGSYRMRVRALQATWPAELAITLQNTFEMMRDEGRAFDLRDYARGFWYLMGPQGLLTGMVPGLLAYLRPDFRPWHDDDSALIAQWNLRNGRFLKRSTATEDVGAGTA